LRKKTGNAPSTRNTIAKAIIGCVFKLYIILITIGPAIRPNCPVPSIIEKQVLRIYTSNNSLYIIKKKQNTYVEPSRAKTTNMVCIILLFYTN